MSNEEDSWAHQTLQSMTTDEKIGQLFLIAGYLDPDFANKEIGNPNIIQDIDRYISEYYVGGIAYVGPSESSKQVALTNHYQEISKYPILIAQDLEWGLSMRLKDGMHFPKNITLEAIQDNDLIYKMGKEIGTQAKLIGVHMNLSPVLDVNRESENPAINVRSFGSSPQKVAEKGVAMIRGLQDAGIIASAKHFPGLGDIKTDPHLALPYSSHNKTRFKEVELYPFAEAIKAGVLSIQTEHLLVPSLDPDPRSPSSLSKKIVQDLLKSEMGFSGLVISGALRMKALTNHLPDEEIVLKAFLAGSDMLLMPQDFPKAHQIVKAAWQQGKITQEEVDQRVLKVLQMKEKANLHNQRITAIPTDDQLHPPYSKELKRHLFQSAISLIRNKQNLVPLTLTKKNSMAYVQLGEDPSNTLLDNLKQNLPIELFSSKDIEKLFQQIDRYDLILVAVFPADPRRIAEMRLLNENRLKEELADFRVHGISKSWIPIIEHIQRYQEKAVVAFFGNPFGQHFFNGYCTFLMAYEDDPVAQEVAFRVLTLPKEQITK